jgi:peptidoglycan/LPS O-acetylase OafA/YrhL
MPYRPDIDGLRALAVLSVLFFHLGFSGFGGGYVGVDVFFVISGFLITRLIRAEVLHADSFSFSNFYMRRARRLAPAMFFTFAVSFACAVVLFSPSDLQRFSGALVHAVASLSNFYFWTESGYFDTAATVKPLLHTWSLSVEEQFYLIWPATLVFLLMKTPRYTVPIVLLLAGLFSLALNLDFYGGDSKIVRALAPSISSWFADGPATIYYLAPFRVFEFAIGASLVFLGGREPTSRALAEVLSVLGLVLILFAVVFYSDATPFPTIYALLPCMGTALLIYCAGTSRYCKFLLSHRWAVRLGLTSYSLYLIHWPIIVFYTYYTKADLSTGERWLIVVASIVASQMMYRWIETPFRHNSKATNKLSPSGFGFVCAMLALVICIVAAGAWVSNGWTWRFGQSATAQAFGDVKELERGRANYLRGQLGKQFEQLETKRQILVVGDSLADDLLIGLVQNLGDDYEVQTERYNRLCYKIFLSESAPDAGPCADILAGLESSTKLTIADEVYIGISMSPNFWTGEFVPLIEYIKRRTKPGTRIVLFGRRPQFPDLHSIAVSMLSQDKSVEQIEERAREISGDLTSLDRQMKAAVEAMGIDFVSSFDIICSSTRCEFFTDDGSLMFWDMEHFSVEGATWFGSHAVDELGHNGEKQLKIAETQASPSLLASTEFEDLPLVDAVKIVQGYMLELSSIGMDDQTVHDISLLPDSKSRITAALLMLTEITSDQQEKSSLQTGIIVLAYFQADVGASAVQLDQMGPSQQTWQEVVDIEKRNLTATLSRLGYGIESESVSQ